MPKREGVFFWDSFPKPDTDRELMICDFMYSVQIKVILGFEMNEVSG